MKHGTRVGNECIRVAVWLVAGLMLSAVSVAQVPQNLSYQGLLADSVGDPVSGPVDVEFSLYAESAGGEPLWSDLQVVTPLDGVFTVILGEPANPFPQDLFDGPLYLGVKVDDDQEMTPRTALTASAFSHRAQDAQTLSGRSAEQLDQAAAVESLTSQVGSNQVAVIQLQTDIEATESDITTLQTSVESTLTDIDQLQSDVSATETALDQVELALPNLQSRVTGVCESGSSIRQVFENGAVTCEIDDQGPWEDNGNGQPFLGASGRVGIGTSAPQASIQIDASTGEDPFRARVNSFTKLRVHANGSVSVGTSSAGTDNGLLVSGQTGIGTSSPSAKTTVQDSGWQFSISNAAAGGDDWYIGSSADSWAAGAGKFIVAPTNSSSDAAVTIDQSKNLGIGLVSPATRLHVAGGSDVTEAGGGFITVGNESSNNIAIDSNEIMARSNGSAATLALNAEGGKVTVNANGSIDERVMEITGEVRIDSGENSAFIFGATNSNPTNGLLKPSSFEEGLVGGSEAPFWRIYSREFYAQSPLQYKTYSDQTVKRNIQPIVGALDLITQIDGVSYELSDHPFDSRKKQKSDQERFYDDNQLGFVAQDLELVLPQLVSEDESSGLKTVSYLGLIPVLVEALKEQQRQLDEQQYEIESLKAKLR